MTFFEQNTHVAKNWCKNYMGEDLDSDLDNDLSLAVLKIRLRSFLSDTDPDSENLSNPYPTPQKMLKILQNK
jgi:hypothetical protein